MTGTLFLGQNASLAFEEFLDDVTNVEFTFWARNGVDADHYCNDHSDDDDVTYEESTFC